MVRRAVPIVALASLLLPLAGVTAAPPRTAPAVYATRNYALTFRPPPGTTYCPLPRDWVGSDHGTVLFLEPPRDCGGNGSPSADLGFSPAEAARIELYYGYWSGDDSPPQPRCRDVGRIVILGRSRPLCRTEEAGMISFSAAAPYVASSSAETIVTLRSSAGRVGRDLAVFRRFAAGLRTCTAAWRGARGQVERFGSGPLCPRTGWF
jgi:hypothetical protein